VTINHDLPVRVFRNLERGCYSIMQRGQVRASACEVLLRAVEFRVRESGRQRMIRERRRNVHAFAVGLLVDYVHAAAPARLRPLAGPSVTYDPYRFPTFFQRDTLAPVVHVALAQFDERGVFCVIDDHGPLLEAA